MRRIAVIPLVVLALSACDEGKATTPPNQQRQVSAAQLAGAMIDSYQGLKVTENDAQDHYQRLEDRLLAGRQWPTVGGGCLKRLSPGGFVKVLGEVGTRAPAAMRAWGTAPNDTRFLQTLVALPGDAAITAARSPLPDKCFDFLLEDPEKIRVAVTERSVPLGDAGRIVDVEMSGGQEQRRGASTVVFAHRGVLAIIIAPRGDFGTFPEQALKRMQEKL